MRNLIAVFAGSLFGVGLSVSGMTDTTKVRGWLDLFGDWDPTLAFVMAGAIVPMAIAWLLTRRIDRSLLGTPIPAKPPQIIDKDLILGSALFGAGWGLTGLCPGPAMTSLSYGGWGGAIFFAAMLAGMYVMPAVRQRINR